MCDQTEVQYLPGEIVWVKLRALWWPGKVQDYDSLPEEIKTSFRKRPIATIKFFQEDSYEYVHKLDLIYHYNCSRKREFIKKGLDLTRKKSADRPSNVDLFPTDVATAEALTGGDPNIIRDDSFKPEEKPKYESLFGGDKKKVGKKKGKDDTPLKDKAHRRLKLSSTPPASGWLSRGSSPNIIRPPPNIPRVITHPRFLAKAQNPDGKSDYEVRVLIQKANDDDAKLSEKEYQCCLCGYRTCRLNVIILHFNTTHSPKFVSTLPRPKILKSRSRTSSSKIKTDSRKSDSAKTNSISKKQNDASHLNDENMEVSFASEEIAEIEASKIKSPMKEEKPGKRGRKRKVKTAVDGDDHDLKKPKVVDSLLADWEEDTEQEQVELEKEKEQERLRKEEESRVAAKAEAVPATTVTPKSKEVFEFDDDDDAIDLDLSSNVKGFGRRIPRVIESSKGKAHTGVETKKTIKTKQAKKSTNDLVDDVDTILAETSVPTLPAIPKSSTFSLDVDFDDDKTLNADSKVKTVAKEDAEGTSMEKLDSSTVETSSSDNVEVSGSKQVEGETALVPAANAVEKEGKNNVDNSKNCSSEEGLVLDSTAPPQVDADTSLTMKRDTTDTSVELKEKNDIFLKSGNKSPKPVVGTGQSTGGGDHNYVIGESTSRRRRRSLLPVERNDELDILSLPIVLGDDFGVEETSSFVSKIPLLPLLPGSERTPHSGRKKRGRPSNSSKAAVGSSKIKETVKRSTHHSTKSPRPVVLKRSRSPITKTGSKSPSAVPKSPPRTANKKSPSIMVDAKSYSQTLSPKSPVSSSTTVSGPKSPLLNTPRSPVTGPKSPGSFVSPRSPPLSGSKSPMAVPKSPPMAGPKSPLMAGPKSPLMAGPKSPPMAGPKSPPMVGPKSPPMVGPKSPPLTSPKSPQSPGPKSPPPVGHKSPLATEPASPPSSASLTSISKNSDTLMVLKSPKSSLEMKSPKSPSVSHSPKTSTLVLKPSTSSPTKSASSHPSLVPSSSSKVVCIPNTTAGDIFSTSKISIPGSVSPPPLVLTTPGKASPSGTSAVPKSSSGSGSIKTIKVSVSGSRGASPLLMQKAGAAGTQPRKLMIVQGKPGSTPKMLVPGPQRMIMQDMGSGKKILLLTKGTSNIVLSPQQQKILSAGGKVTTLSGPGNKGAVLSHTSNASAGSSTSPPSLVKTDSKKIKIIKSSVASTQGSKGNVVLTTNSGQILVPVSSLATSGSAVLSPMSTAGGSKSFLFPVGAAKLMKSKSPSGGKMVFQMPSSQSKLMLPPKAGSKSPQMKFVTQSVQQSAVAVQPASELQTVSLSPKSVKPKPGSPVKQTKALGLPRSLKKLAVATKSSSQQASPGEFLPASGSPTINLKTSNIVQGQPKGKQSSGIIPNPNLKSGVTQLQPKTSVKKSAPVSKVASTDVSVAAPSDGGNVQVVSNIPVSLEQIQTNLLTAASPSDTGTPTALPSSSQQLVTVSTEDGGQVMYLIDNSALLGLDGSNQAVDGSPRTLIIDPSSLASSQGNLQNLILTFDNVAQPSASSADFAFPTQSSGQDILAEALANTQVLQPDSSGNDLSLDSSGLLSAHSGNTLYQSNVPTLSHGVLETSLTLNQPIMTPLEDLSAVSSLQPPPVASTSLDLPITITQPDITISTSSYSSLPIPSATVQNTVFSDAQQITPFNTTVPILATEVDSDSGSVFIESAVPESETYASADDTYETPSESASMPLLDTP